MIFVYHPTFVLFLNQIRQHKMKQRDNMQLGMKVTLLNDYLMSYERPIKASSLGGKDTPSPHMYDII